MNIGIDCRLWSKTGVGRYIRNLITELGNLKNPHEFVLFCMEEDEEDIKLQISHAKYPKQFATRIANIKWHSVDEQLKFPKIIEAQNLDLMHFTYFSVPIRYSGKFVMTMHDMIPFIHATGRASTLPGPVYMGKKLAYKFIVKKALRKSFRVLVPSIAVEKDIVKTVSIPESKIVVTYEGTSDFDHIEDPELNIIPHKYFLYVGNAYPHKNLEKLTEAFLQFSSQNEGYQLVLAGNTDYFYKRLLESPTAQALGSSLVFASSMRDAELKFLYKYATAFVSPSLMEGFALPALESLSLGTPVILSDIPVFKELCKDVPIAYFDPQNTSAITGALEATITLPSQRRQEKIKLGRVLSHKYSWRDMAEETLSVYNAAE